MSGIAGGGQSGDQRVDQIWGDVTWGDVTWGDQTWVFLRQRFVALRFDAGSVYLAVSEWARWLALWNSALRHSANLDFGNLDFRPVDG